MNIQQMHVALSDIEQQLALLAKLNMPVADFDTAHKVYIPSIRETIRVVRLQLNEQPKNLLTHLTLLTVAERETILRIADIGSNLFDDEMKTKYAEFAATRAIELVKQVELQLREEYGTPGPFEG